MAALFAFLSSFSFVLSALALTRLLEPMRDARWSDLQSVALGVAVGLVARFPAKLGRVAAFPRTLAFAQIAFGIAAAVVVRVSTAGPYAGETIDAIAMRAMLLAPLAFTYGQVARRVLLFAGVPKLERLTQSGGLVAGLALGAAGWLWGIEARVDAGVVAFAAPFVLFARFALRGLDRADMPEPEPYGGGFRCLPSLVGGLLLAYAVAALLRIETRLGDEFESTFALQCAALGIAALVVPWMQATARRCGLMLGALALFALAIRLFAWRFVPGDAWGETAVESLRYACLVAPAACLGAGLALLARFYFGVPGAKKILAQIPAEQRRTPAGAPARAAVMCLGLVIGAIVELPDPPVEVFRPFAIIGAAGAALLVFFDPRAGIGRRITWLGIGGGAFTAAALI